MKGLATSLVLLYIIAKYRKELEIIEAQRRLTLPPSSGKVVTKALRTEE